MKILLVNLSTLNIYKKTNLKVGMPLLPPLTLAVLAAPLLEQNHKISLCDFNLTNNPEGLLINKLNRFDPEYVAISVMTASFDQMIKVTSIVKRYNKNIKIIIGGPHISTFPIESLEKSFADISVIGEGDFILPEIISGKNLEDIQGICYKKNNKIISKNRTPNFIEDIDKLPFPAWKLFNIKKYKTPKLISRRRPVGPIETSRGCVFGCTYCNKCIFGKNFRPKSAERVVNEIEFMLSCGFKEIHTIDDGFSTNIDRAKKICDLIKERNLDFTWNIRTGMRVDRVDEELLKKMHEAGCYRISFGVESGSQEILNNVKKGTTISKIKEVFKMAHDAGFETLAFFMFGLPGETEKTMKKSIEFAKKLNPYIIKPGILTPLPGTPLFNEWDSKGHIKTKEWSKYTYDDPSEIYDHPNLDWPIIKKYYKKFFREFYFRPKYISKRLFHDIKNGLIFSDIEAFLKIRWFLK